MNPINLTDLAERLESGLNTQLGNPEIQFKIWSEAGEYKPFFREGNTVIWYINGNLRRVTSSNDANDLIMGVNGLTLDFAIPIQRPRTNATQPEEELFKINDGQYQFVEYITSAVNDYFETAQTYTFPFRNSLYTVAFRAGSATTGEVDIVPALGNCLIFSVFIELYYIQDGINSKQIKLTVDNQNVPFKALRWGRSPMLEREVYQGSLVSTSVITSTAFTIDVDMPTLTGAAFEYVTAFLMGGTPNLAHFVKLDIGGVETTYFMTLHSAQSSAENINVSGSSISFMEVSDGYFYSGNNYVGQFVVPDSGVKTITAQITFADNRNSFVAYVGGKCPTFTNNFTLSVIPSMVRYDKAKGKYYVQIVFPPDSKPVVASPQADGASITYTETTGG